MTTSQQKSPSTASKGSAQALDFDRMANLVHYVCWKCENPLTLGAIKLNKVLWMTDVRAYLQDGKSLTGETYIKRQYGPVPKHILDVLGRLEKSGAIFIRDVEYDGHPKRDFLPLKAANPDAFSGREISLIDRSIEFVCHKNTAKSISDYTHDQIWKLAEIGEQIPLNAMFAVRAGEVTEDDIVWAKSAVA
jgi:hypothetical protein